MAAAPHAMPAALQLPNANVVRVCKEALPESCGMTKDAKAAMAKAASLFVLCLTAAYVPFGAHRGCTSGVRHGAVLLPWMMVFGRLWGPVCVLLCAHSGGKPSVLPLMWSCCECVCVSECNCASG
jgi:hypothetical protein